MRVTCFIVVGYDVGLAKKLADLVIHANIDDMQIVDDIQVIIGQMMMKSLHYLSLILKATDLWHAISQKSLILDKFKKGSAPMNKLKTIFYTNTSHHTKA